MDDKEAGRIRSMFCHDCFRATKAVSFTAHLATIGVDLAKHAFQTHGVDATGGGGVIRRKRRREEVKAFLAKLPPCLMDMEACGPAHHCGGN